MDTATSQLEIVEASSKKRRFRVTLLPELIRLEVVDDGQVHEVARSEIGTKLELHDNPMMRRTVVARIPKPVMFKLEPEVFAKLKEWVGPPSPDQLATELKKRLRWTLPIGIVFMLTSVPVPGVPEQGIPPIPFDVVGFTLGATLVLLSLLARFRPQRNLFLLDGLWCLALAAETAWGVLRGSSNPLWLLLSLFLVMIALPAFEQYRRFDPELVSQTVVPR